MNIFRLWVTIGLIMSAGMLIGSWLTVYTMEKKFDCVEKEGEQ